MTIRVVYAISLKLLGKLFHSSRLQSGVGLADLLILFGVSMAKTSDCSHPQQQLANRTSTQLVNCAAQLIALWSWTGGLRPAYLVGSNR